MNTQLAIPYWCLLIHLLSPFLWVALAKSSVKPYDNHNPRSMLEKTTAWGRRAYYVELNTYESLSLFASAVLVNALRHHGHFSPLCTKLAMSYLALRFVYGFCYIKDYASCRSLAWALSVLTAVGLFFA